MSWELGSFWVYEIEIDFLEYSSEFFDRCFDLGFFFTIGDLREPLDHCE